MAFWLHIAEVAALIAVAYTVGCLVGVFAHRMVLGLGRKPAIAVAAALPETAATVVAAATAETTGTETPLPEASPEPVPLVAALDVTPSTSPDATLTPAAPVPSTPDLAATVGPLPTVIVDERPLIRWYDVPPVPAQVAPTVDLPSVAVAATPAESDPFVTAVAALATPQVDASSAIVDSVAAAPTPVETPASRETPVELPPLPAAGAAQAALAAETLLAALEAVAPPTPREQERADLVATSDPSPLEPSPPSAVAVIEPVAATRPIAAESPVAIDERIVAAVIAAAREVQSGLPANVIEPEPPVAALPPTGARLVDDVPVAKPAKTPGLAWSGMIKGRTSSAFVRRLPHRDKPPVPAATQAPSPPVVAAPPAAEVRASLAASIAAELATPEPVPTPAPQPLAVEQDSIVSNIPAAIDPAQPLANRPPVADSALTAALFETIATELAIDPNAPPPPRREPPKPVQPAPAAPEAIAPVAPPAEPEALPAEPIPVAVDEDDAMHAIEGGWSRRDTRAMSGAPELADVGAAVAAAQIAVETVLAKSGIDPTRSSDLGKPRGLPRPRNAKRDNLQTIRGLGQLDETALNNLGIFHLDQIVEWDQRAILWLENHAFARGRIAREDWQGQARALIGDASDIRVTR